MAGDLTDNDVYVAEAGHVRLHGHIFRMMALPYHLEQKGLLLGCRILDDKK